MGGGMKNDCLVDCSFHVTMCVLLQYNIHSPFCIFLLNVIATYTFISKSESVKGGNNNNNA